MASEALPRVTFGIIVLNGEPFTRYCLRSVYPFAHQIIVVEGAAPGARGIATPDGHSRDGTLDILRDFKRHEDPEGKLTILTAEDWGHADGFWPGEKHEQSRAYATRATGDYLWQVDIDEFYRHADMQALLARLRDDPGITAVSFKQLGFWGGFDYLAEAWHLRRGEAVFHRLFRWGRGYRYTTHRPPTVVDRQGRDLRSLHWLSARQLARQGIYLYHYSLLFPKQVLEKCEYYDGAQWAPGHGYRAWAECNYLRLQDPFRVHNVHQNNPSWLTRFSGPHPEQIETMRADIAAGRLNVELRPTDDVQRLLNTWWYRPACQGLKLLDYVDRAVAPLRRPLNRFTQLPRRVLRRVGRQLGQFRVPRPELRDPSGYKPVLQRARPRSRKSEFGAGNFPVIIVENLSKRYKIGRPLPPTGAGHGGPTTALRRHFRRLAALSQRGQEDEFIWALRDASFEVHPGEVVGIIGRNGSGKSTLLKILSRVVHPTTGRAVVRGRVGSLLEVGTGFHPELTGRENIYLNGAILGMRRDEIRRVFDEIVAFAEIDRFLDTPVKRYSSGMYVRLAFAVAAHLNPEILLVDEVLAVGDAPFQRKCLENMATIARSGRTVLFVSHSMAAVANLCTRGVVLRQGRISFIGTQTEALAHYLSSTYAPDVSLASRTDRRGSGVLRFAAVRTRNSAGCLVASFLTGQDAVLELAYQAEPNAALPDVQVAVGIDDSLGQRVANLSSEVTGQRLGHLAGQAGAIWVHLPRLPLLPGRYYVTLYAAAGGQVLDWVQNAAYFDVEAGDFFGTGKLPPQGCFCLDGRFELRADVDAGCGLVTVRG